MSIFDPLLSYFRRFVVTTPGNRVADGYDHSSGERIEECDVLGLASAWACVNLIAGTIGSLPLMVYQDGAGGRVVAKRHPLYRLLHDSPNTEQTALDFWEGAAASIELKGNAVALKAYSVSGDVVSLTPLAWDYLTVRRDRQDALIYEYKGETYAADDVLHIRGFGGAPEAGLSTIAFGAGTFGLARAINKAAGSTFKNGIHTSGVLTKEGTPFTGTQRADAEKLLREKYSSAMRAGVPMLLDNGLKWQAVAINPDDAQLLESRAFSVEEVCRMFGVPPHMIGHTEKTSSWGTGIEQMTLGFVKYTLRRRLKRIEQALEKQLLTPADRAAGITIEFNLEGLLRGDSANRSAFYNAGLSNGWLTINEVRALENLPPVKGGDQPRMQMQNVPITQAGEQPALPAA